MLAKIFVMLIKPNLPHLLGVFVYGLIVIVLAAIAYKIFSVLIPLKIGFESHPTETLSASILACGIMIGIGLVVAVTAYEPPLNPNYPSTISLVSKGGGAAVDPGCGSCAVKPKDAAVIRPSGDSGQAQPQGKSDIKPKA